MTILIVEDEPRASRGLKNLIEQIGEDFHVVGEALDGKEALELIKMLNPDVVMTDIRMPVMDGMALIMAANAQFIKTKFVIISAYEEFETARKAISLGVADYLVKPIALEDVRQVLYKLAHVDNSSADSEKNELVREYPGVHPLIRKSLIIIEKSYQSKFTQKDIAETLGVTAEYFSYLFAKNIGDNFARFLRKYRIEVAKKLLQEGKTDKDDIAYQVGFTDAKYFCKCFKEETGVSVNEYLRNR